MTNPPHSRFIFLKQFQVFMLQKKLYSQVESSFVTPSLPQSALLWLCSLIFFRCNLSSGTHVLQFYVPKSKETCIVHIDISCNIITYTKRISQIHKNQICANNLYLHILETFYELSPFFCYFCIILWTWYWVTKVLIA